MIGSANPAKPHLDGRPGWRPNTPIRTATIGLLLVALFVLAFIGHSIYTVLRTPWTGIDWLSSTRVVSSVDPTGPAHDRVQVGETVKAINGLELVGKSRPYVGQTPGDSVIIDLIDLAGHPHTVTLTLGTIGVQNFVENHLAFYLVALTMWLTGVIVVLLVNLNSPAGWDAQLYFAFSQLTSLVFALVQRNQSVDVIWDEPYVIAATWLSAASILLHLRFPRAWVAPETSRRLALVAVLASLLITTFDLLIVDELIGWARNRLTTLWILPLTVIVVAALIVLPTPADRDDGTRQARGIVALFAMIGMAPYFLQAMAILFGGLLLERPIKVLAETLIIFLPIGYGYAILRYRFIRYEGTISRAVGYLIAVLGLAGSLGLGGLGLSMAGIGAPMVYWALGLIAIPLAIMFEPARRRIQPFIDRIVLSQWDEFRAALRGVARSLDESTDIAAWAQGLCDHFARALGIQPVGLLMRIPQGRALRLISFDPDAVAAGLPSELDPLTPFVTKLAEWDRPATTAELRSVVDLSALATAERLWLDTRAFDLWWPIRATAGLHGVLALGPKIDGYSSEEQELLTIAVRQIAAVLDNVQFARELEQLSRAALQTRDTERQRVSRDLNDHIIQPLVSLNFALAAARDVPIAGEARTQVSELIAHVRRISADLRPPALDEVGLPAAARGLVRTFSRTYGLPVDFVVRPSDDLYVPEPLASTFYGALREALNNIGRHAQANRVSVLLEAQADRLFLVIHDDGRGFTPPARLGQLAPSGHFGLLGIQERLAAVGGSIEIHSELGQGTRVQCHANLQMG